MSSVALKPADNRDAQVIAMFLNNKARRSKNTARVYQFEITRFFDLIHKPLGSITLEDLQMYASTLENLAPASQARALTTIRSMFKFAAKIGYLRWNPSEVLELPKVQVTSEQRYLTKKEIMSLTQAAKKKNKVAYLAVAMLSLTGLRIGELTRIEWKDFYSDLMGNIGLNVKGKGDKLRQVKIRPDLWELIKVHREDQGLGTEINNQDKTPLFRNRKGGAISDRYLRRLITECAKKAGIKKEVSPHWLRHTACTLAILGGAPLMQVQQDLGHASINTTMRYMHSVKQLQRTSTDYIELNI